MQSQLNSQISSLKEKQEMDLAQVGVWIYH